MNAATNRSMARTPNRYVGGRRNPILGDELTIAGRRMRHLAPWHVEPLPMMHSAVGCPPKALSTEQRAVSERLALQVLAVQMWLTTAQSAML